MAVEMVDHRGGWKREDGQSDEIRFNIKVTNSKHIGNPVRCKTTSTPNTRGDRDWVNVLVL